MKYHCTGVNKETGARMTLEFHAASKAAAERKADQQGMEVHHAHEVHDGELPVERQTHRGEHSGRSGSAGKLIGLAVALVVAVVIAVMFWGRLIGMLRR